MKFFFIGGLGSNENHISEFAHCFPYPITYLNPYKLKLESFQDLLDWFEAHADSNERLVSLPIHWVEIWLDT